MSGSSSPRPLIDIGRRSSSRDGGLLRSTASSRHSTPSHSPFGSPVNSPPLRSAMKARSSPSIADAAKTGFDLSNESVSTLDVSGDGDDDRGRKGAVAAALPASGLMAATASSGSLGSMYSRRVGFDTFNSGVELDQTGSSTGGGTGTSLLPQACGVIARGGLGLTRSRAKASTTRSPSRPSPPRSCARSKPGRTWSVPTSTVRPLASVPASLHRAHATPRRLLCARAGLGPVLARGRQ